MAQREADLRSFAIAVEATSAPVAAEEPQVVVEGGAPPPEEDIDISPRERQLILWLTNISHGVNHFQGQMLTPLYPLIMTDLGFGFAALGVINAVNNIIMNGAQLGYGFLTPFMQRTRLLGIGYIVMCVGTLLTGMSNSFASLIGARGIMGIGGSPPHP